MSRTACFPSTSKMVSRIRCWSRKGFVPRWPTSQLALLFPQLAGASVTHRWGGLQSFTADYLPQAGLLDAERNIYGIAGFGGRGNCHSDVGAEYLVAQALRIETAFSRQFAALIESLLQVRREGANWGPWTSAYQP